MELADTVVTVQENNVARRVYLSNFLTQVKAEKEKLNSSSFEEINFVLENYFFNNPDRMYKIYTGLNYIGFNLIKNMYNFNLLSNANLRTVKNEFRVTDDDSKTIFDCFEANHEKLIKLVDVYDETLEDIEDLKNRDLPQLKYEPKLKKFSLNSEIIDLSPSFLLSKNIEISGH